jgi:YD repeat-containing protein
MGFTDGFAYNGFGQPLRHTDANQKVTTYAYCDCGSLESINDPLGNVTSYTWDNAGRRTRTTWPGSSGYTDFVYDTPGYLIRVTESSGVSVTNYYTVHGLPYTASNALGRVFRRLYDDGNRISISIDHNGTTNSYGYDALGRLLRSTNSIAKVSEKGVGPGSVPSMLGSALLASSSGK